MVRFFYLVAPSAPLCYHVEKQEGVRGGRTQGAGLLQGFRRSLAAGGPQPALCDWNDQKERTPYAYYGH